jgi:hypothetical protein
MGKSKNIDRKQILEDGLEKKEKVVELKIEEIQDELNLLENYSNSNSKLNLILDRISDMVRETKPIINKYYKLRLGLMS